MELEIRSKVFRGGTFNFACDPNNHASWWSFTDEESVRERWWNVQPGDVVLDCGAAFGSYALPALALGASKVVAWTPEGHMPYLVASLEANPGWSTRVLAFDSGLWSGPGWLEAMEGAAAPVFHRLRPESWKTTMPPNAFAVTTVDEVLPKVDEIARVDWLKLDVEGAELEVLRGASKTIRRFRPAILCENHLFKDSALQQKCSALIDSFDAGYREVETVAYHSVSHSLYVAPPRR
jgi:FkbM family methyltransferase